MVHLLMNIKNPSNNKSVVNLFFANYYQKKKNDMKIKIPRHKAMMVDSASE